MGLGRSSHPVYKTDAPTAARDTAATLAKAAEAYVAAFRADPADYYPGINALTADSDDVGVRWAEASAIQRGRDPPR